MKYLSLAIACIGCGLITSPTVQAAQYRAYRVGFHTDRDPQTLDGEARQFATSSQGKALITAAGAYFGADPRLVAVGLATIQPEKRQGEDTFQVWAFEPGWVFCKLLNVHNVSLSPKDGNRKSKLEVKVSGTTIHSYSWTPRGNIGSGRSWAGADFDITTVPSADFPGLLNAGKCQGNYGLLWASWW